MFFEKVKSFFYKCKENNLFRNMVESGIYKPIAMFLSYIYVRFALSYLGIEKYGVWSTILTIVSWIAYFDIGIGNGLKNRLTEAIDQHDNELCKKYISSSYIIISVIMLIMCILFCFLTSIISWKEFIKAENVDESIQTIICLSVVFLAINFVLQICKSVLFAFQKAAMVSQMELTRQSLNLIGILLLRLFSNGTILYVAILYGITMFITNMIYTFVAYKELDFTPSLKYYDKEVGCSLTNLGLKFLVIQICALVLFTTDNLLISHFFGAANVTPYNTVNKAFQAIYGIHAAFITPVWTAVTKAKAKGNYKWIQAFTIKTSKIAIPFSFVAIILALLFRPFSYLWLGQELNYTTMLILLGCVYCIFTMICNTFACIANGLELMEQSIIVALIQTVVNIPLSIFFAITIGLETSGILLGTVVSIGIAAIVQPIIVYKCIRKNLGNM